MFLIVFTGSERRNCLKFCVALPPSMFVCVFMCSYRKMIEVCGDAESKLAFEQSQHEVQLERDILDPLNQLAEVTATIKKRLEAVSQ